MEINSPDHLTFDHPDMTDISFIKFPIFEQFEELICAFSTRCGGFSKGVFSSLNMGNVKNDGYDNVMNNRHLFFNKLDIEENAVALPDQIHSANVRIISSAGIISKSDALITTMRGLYLGIQTADCFPIFLYAPKKKIVGIVHAGWKGAVDDILMKTTVSMINNFDVIPSELYIAIGPGLQKECFEVKADVFNKFSENFLETHPDPSKKYLNLAGFLNQQLISLKIPAEQIFISSDCTKCNQKMYYSYRRNGEKSGRMMGIIGMQS